MTEDEKIIKLENIPEDEQIEGLPLCCHIFSNGNCLFFDEQGKQITEIQKKGISGIFEYMEKYPKAKYFWSVWDSWTQEVTKDSIKNLMNYIKEP